MKALLLALSLLSTMALAQDAHMHKATIPKQFETLNKLLGTWQGVNKMGEQEMPIKVTYASTSAGTAITETLMQGTPEEMVSVYHKDGDTVAMTHYCALGNQPHMQLVNASDREMAFQMQQPTGLSSAQEPHMHAVTLKLLDDNTLQQSWVYYVDGKPSSTVEFTFHRSH